MFSKLESHPNINHAYSGDSRSNTSPLIANGKGNGISISNM